MPDFALHERLVAATHALGDLPLSRVLLLDDHRFPWLLLVPRRAGITEIHQLSAEDRAQLIEEIAATSQVLSEHFEATRMNVADIGNKAPQLHVHVVARREDDASWPDVVWSREREPYPAEALARRVAEIRELLAGVAGFVGR